MTVSNELRTCPKCGASGGLILDATESSKSTVAEMLVGTCGVGYMDCSLADFVRGIKCFIDEESQGIRCDTHLINLLRRAACLAWEHEQLFNSQFTENRQSTSLCDAIKEVEKMRDENNRNYGYWKSVSSNPDTDLGVLKFAAWAGEDERVITALKSLGPQRED